MAPFKIVALGDSIVWGQGLEEADKFTSIVAREIGPHAEVVARYAFSGAAILEPGQGPRSYGATDAPGDVRGEVPNGSPSLWRQLEGLDLDERFENYDVDLVIMDGGINDVEVYYIHNPLVSMADIRKKTRMVFTERLPPLLREVTKTFPNARIVFTGYYPVVSKRTFWRTISLPEVLLFLRLIGGRFRVPGLLGVVSTAVIIDRLRRRSVEFAELSDTLIAQAIDGENRRLDEPRVAFARVGWPPERSILTKKSWLWGFGDKGSIREDLDEIRSVRLVRKELRRAFPFFLPGRYEPQDSLADERAEMALELSDSPQATWFYSSVGHPNREGARVYADAIIRALGSLAIPERQASTKEVINMFAGAEQ